jgi:glycosyltransferase involved in cell wall biosynthesis
MSNTYNISIVIPTFNRGDILDMTLRRLWEQTADKDAFEVLVIDDGSTDNTEALVKNHLSEAPFRLRYYRHENRGPGYSQNFGAKQTDSDIILILADDVLASKNLVQEHIKAHQQYADENVAILGKVLQSTELPQTVFQRNWDPFRYDKLEGMHELPAIYFFGCNVSAKKKFLLENGMFLERKGAAHEDIELGYRLGRKGLRIMYSVEALGFHHHPETLQSACRRAYERGKNFDLLAENIPKPYIYKLYSILAPEAGWKACLSMLPRELLRGFFFNSLSVNYFWLPVLNKAERSRLAACFANSYTYRGTVNYHLRSGYWDKRNSRE